MIWHVRIVASDPAARSMFWQSMFPDSTHTATQYPDDSEPCVSATSSVCLYFSEKDVDDNLACYPKTDGSNILTPAVILAEIEAGRVQYPPPSPPPPSPPLLPPTPSPPPSSFTCSRNTLPSTQYRKALNTISSDVWQKLLCWRWQPTADWPPFMAHRDIYQKVERCGGALSRDVLWNGGLRQSRLEEEDYDRFFNSNNECPRLETGTTIIKREQANRQTDACEDSSDPTGLNGNGFCDLGTNLETCSVLPNLIVFGYSNLSECMSWGQDETGAATFTITGSSSTVCRDGGAGSETLGIGVCTFGTDTTNCGMRRFAFPADKSGPIIPDDSCLSAKNQICEDGLLYSKYAPGSNPCEPNTEYVFGLEHHNIIRH